jgi:PPOX class probable F420-dependent enzyme
MATIDSKGHPHLVPITFVMDGGVLYSAVDAKPKRTRHLKRLDNISRTPEVAVLIDAYDDDWSRLWWCRIDGRARVVHAGAELERGLAALTGKYPQYREEPPAGPVIVVEVRDETGWTASD